MTLADLTMQANRNAYPRFTRHDNYMPLRCLIVDDNPQFASTARRLLESEGLIVLAMVSTGAEAIDLVRELKPDVVLLDIDLGTESGFDVATQLDNYDFRPAPEIILVSAHDEEDFADLIAESAAVGFLAKSALSARGIRQLINANGERHQG
ncbi:LytR/AlgR family response regulator transcription factor [Jatrophihabitans sp. DSM 45814]